MRDLDPFETTITVEADEIPVTLQQQDREACISFTALDLNILVTRDKYGDVGWYLMSVEAEGGYQIAADLETCEPIERRIMQATQWEMANNHTLKQRIEDAVDRVLPAYDYHAEHRLTQHELL